MALPTKIPVFQAQCRLYPPHSPTTSSISPAKYRLGQISDSHVSGLISVRGMPPFVACALFHARCLEGEIGNRFNPFVIIVYPIQINLIFLHSVGTKNISVLTKKVQADYSTCLLEN